MPRIGNHKRYLSPNQGRDRKISVQKKFTRRKGNYILEETIGEGAFAKVKLGTHIHTGEKVAIKILNKEKLFEEALEDNLANGIEGCDIQKIRKEINILKRLRHKNVIQLYEIMESKTNLYIVMEYCEGKELFDYIVHNKYLSEREACRFFQQIIDGVEYLHLSNITHRDLKPENLLLDNKKRIRISDFGLSNMSDKIDSLLETPCGTPSYAPPEMLRGERYNGVYSDIWSCGIILYTMLVGNLPCAESKEDLIYENIMTHNYYYPENVSDEAIDLIENMLKVDPNDRYDFEQIKSHPWFNLVEPKLKPGIVYGVHKVPIDENILNKVEEYGYDRNKCLKSLENYSYDANSSIYYLTLKQFTRENKASISDLFSNKYLNYLKNYENWLKPEEINNPLFMNYEVEMPFEIEQEKAKNYLSNALLAYNDKSNKNRNIKSFESIPEEETKNNKSFEITINNNAGNYIETEHPLSTQNKKTNMNKRVFHNEIEKFKKEDEKVFLFNTQNKNDKNKNRIKTEKKSVGNNKSINASIVVNTNKKKFGKKSSGKTDNCNTSAKKVNNLFYSKIKTPIKKYKIRKNISHEEISNHDNNMLHINIKEIIKKRVKNKKNSVDNCKSNQINKEKEKEKVKLINLSNSKNKKKENDLKSIEINFEIKDNKTNENENQTINNRNANESIKKYENKSIENKDKMTILIEKNLEENSIKKKKKKIKNNKNNKTITNNNNSHNNNNSITKSSNITSRTNQKVKEIEKEKEKEKEIEKEIEKEKEIEREKEREKEREREIEKELEKENEIINNKINAMNERKESKILKESLSKISNVSKIENQDELSDRKTIIQQMNENNNNNKGNNNTIHYEQSNKTIQDQFSNCDKTILSDYSSMSRTILSPKAYSVLSSDNATGANIKGKSSYSKRVEYSNTKAKKKIKARFKKRLGEEEKNLELIDLDKINDIEKNKLIQKLEKDEERLKKEINLINNVTADTTMASLNNINNNSDKDMNDGCMNMLHMMAKRMLKNSIFKKYLINNKKPKKPIKEDIENKFYTLQKYKNIIGMVEHLKNKMFKKKYTDFNYETFDEYLNDEDDKLFNQALLKTMGINRFIKNAKNCLYKKEKLTKRSHSKAYGLNSFKFNKIFQANQKPARYATTKKMDYCNPYSNKLNFGYYKPKRNLNLSTLSSTTNSNRKFKKRRINYNNYTTINSNSITPIIYDIPETKGRQKNFASEQNTIYYPEKSTSQPKKMRINIKTFKYNKNNNSNHHSNILHKIRERITNIHNSLDNKKGITIKSKKKNNNKYNSIGKNRTIGYDSDYNDKHKKRIRNMSNSSMNNIFESEESISSNYNYNSSIDKDRINKNESINYDSQHEVKDDDIYKQNKNITTPELGSKFNNKFAQIETNKYDIDNDDEQFTGHLPISVNLSNMGNITAGPYSKKTTIQNDNLSRRDRMHINFNDINDKKKISKNNNTKGNQKILYNAVFSPKVKKNNNIVPYIQKNKLTFGGKKKDISVKDTEKLNKEIWGGKNNMDNNNRSVLDINKIDINKLDFNADNFKNTNIMGENQLSLEDNEAKNLNKTTINVSKKNNKEKLNEIKDNMPIDLNNIINMTSNEIKSKAKTYFKKYGFFYNEKDSTIKATRGGTIIEITLYKIDNEANNIYCNARIKTNDLRKEKDIMKKLLISLNKKE